MVYINKPVPGASQYYPLNEPQIGATYTDAEEFPQNKKLPLLFHPVTIRGVTFPNRIFVSPMCQYSSDNGHATDWHLVHIGGFASRGVGAICMEASAVVPEGRISPEDAGIWTDTQVPPLKRIVDFAHAQGAKIGIQLGHAGRKASTYAPWVHNPKSHTAQNDEGGWPDEVYGPSDIPFSDIYPKPKAMTEDQLQTVEDAFVAAAERCRQLDFDFIEIHNAHGYLLHTFLSPLSNARTDAYGGQALENRMRYPLRIVKALRAAWPDKPLFVRISGTDWAEDPERGEDGLWKYWGIEQSKIFVGEMVKLGVDLVDVSSGGLYVKQQIPIGPGYQVHLAEAIRKAYPDLPVSTVGLITDPVQAEAILQKGQADVVTLARELLRNPHWPMHAAEVLGCAIKPANQYERAFTRMMKPHASK